MAIALKIILIILAFGMAGAVETAAEPAAPCRLDRAADGIPEIELKPVVRGLRAPLGLTHAGDGTGILYGVEQGGRIRMLSGGKLLAEPFLDIRDRVRSGGEMGLLGLAFHPAYSKNGRFYVNYTAQERGLRTVISEFQAEGKRRRIDPDTERILLTIRQPYANHNGGHLAFGPDGKLYIGTGDGGAGNDPENNGQDLSTLLGKMLRIDVDKKQDGREYAIPATNPFARRKGAAPEIWAFGLRNPWRFSFDPVSRLLYAGDVGQSAREEIDIIRKGKNYGWRIMEGNLCTPGISRRCDKSGLEPPLYDYPRSEGTVVIGGYVYRGSAHPALCGAYVYADYGNGRIFGLRHDGDRVTQHRVILDSGRSITSFGVDEAFELYVVDGAGEILKVTAKLAEGKEGIKAPRDKGKPPETPVKPGPSR